MLLELLRRLLLGSASPLSTRVGEERLGNLEERTKLMENQLGEMEGRVARMDDHLNAVEARINEFLGVSGYSS